MPHVYGDIHSGNCYKVKLLLTQLGIAHTWEHVDILAGATHTPEFLAMNPEGRIPLVRLDDGRLLAESNAILNYYAEGSPLLPADRYLRLGSQARGWVQLSAVRLGYELWRQLNRFPPRPTDAPAQFTGAGQ